MVHIASTTLTSDNSVTFSSIPQNFTHLQVRAYARSARGTFDSEWFLGRLNGDAGNNYASHTLRANGSNVFSDNYTTTSIFFYGYVPPDQITAGIFGNYVIDILDYTNTNKYKTIRSIGGYDNNGVAGTVPAAMFCSGLWMNTNAVTSISLLGNATLKTGTRIDLYGITTSQVTGA